MVSGRVRCVSGSPIHGVSQRHSDHPEDPGAGHGQLPVRGQQWSVYPSPEDRHAAAQRYRLQRRILIIRGSLLCIKTVSCFHFTVKSSLSMGINICGFQGSLDKIYPRIAVLTNKLQISESFLKFEFSIIRIIKSKD